MTVLDDVSAIRAARTATSFSAYVALVDAIASDKPVDRDTADRTLSDAGLSTKVAKSDVASIRKARSLAVIASTREQRRAEAEKAHSEAAAFQYETKRQVHAIRGEYVCAPAQSVGLLNETERREREAAQVRQPEQQLLDGIRQETARAFTEADQASQQLATMLQNIPWLSNLIN